VLDTEHVPFQPLRLALWIADILRRIQTAMNVTEGNGYTVSGRLAVPVSGGKALVKSWTERSLSNDVAETVHLLHLTNNITITSALAPTCSLLKVVPSAAWGWTLAEKPHGQKEALDVCQL
jgi:hypothetical protein